MKDFQKVSPLRILEKSDQGSLGRGNLGVLMARAGVGKTACLIHIALDKLFRKEKLIHVSLVDVPEKVTSYYNVIFYDLVKALGWRGEEEIKMIMDRNRMILAYLNQSFRIPRLKQNIANLVEKIDFIPETLIVDGLDFANAGPDTLRGFKEIAHEFQVEIWLSALSDPARAEVNERGIPHPCAHVDQFLSMIVQLNPTPSATLLRLLKDHDNPVKPDASVSLDPNTFLVLA
ncbi:MAG: hypothetical protein CVU57_10405 [Deltaproteobacteria bacterium HGW-Deltaproteobacteria-15]|jgi:hypothetical protein|nr:MAG: hypothetical protein CVU57_10405 [Deltaproteobacteria bacterium HGW-Deltaproteobacteria-15]